MPSRHFVRLVNWWIDTLMHILSFLQTGGCPLLSHTPRRADTVKQVDVATTVRAARSLRLL